MAKGDATMVWGFSALSRFERRAQSCRSTIYVVERRFAAHSSKGVMTIIESGHGSTRTSAQPGEDSCIDVPTR
jgi:hypothetical protein